LFVEVALPLPVPRTFTYRVPDEMRPAAQPGARVLVPFGSKEKIGWIDRVVEGEPGGKVERIKPIAGVLEAVPSATGAILELSRWIAEYYLAPLGQVLRTALPAGLTESTTDYVALEEGAAVDEESLSPQEAKLVRWLQSREGPQPVARLRRDMGDRAWWPVIRRLTDAGLVRVDSEGPRTAPAVRTRRVVRIVRHVPSLLEREGIFARAPRQREAYEMLEALGGQSELSHLTGTLGFSSAVVKGLVEKGLAAVADEEVSRDPYANIEVGAAPRLRPTPAQADIIRRLVAATRTADPGTFLLRGVTGSGKTLVYIELLREVVERQGKTAIVLVPEIALTPQTVGRFKAVFGDRVAVLHSALSDGERYDEWRSLRAGEKQIVVGARSAVFAPLANLGAIVVDEEHESSYKQADAPRYHAREVAVVRARIEGAVCLLGSATPALESWTNAQTGKYTLVELPERVGGQPLPPIRIVDLRQERKRQKETAGPLQKADMGPIILADVLVDAVHERIRREEQTILLLNRRGYASFVQCRDCGFVWHCPNCNVSLTFHRRRGLLTCHYCLHEEQSPKSCTACGSTDLSFRGVGTEQVERSVGEAFPSARIARMDVDTTGGKWAHHDILGRVERREVDILLGTQMIAKGWTSPTSRSSASSTRTWDQPPDFRATERTFQLLTQVAGRAGRGPQGRRGVHPDGAPQPLRHRVRHGARLRGLRRPRAGGAPRAQLPPALAPGERRDQRPRRGPHPGARRRRRRVGAGPSGDAQAGGGGAGGPRAVPHRPHPQPLALALPPPLRQLQLLGEVARYFHERFDIPKNKADLRLALDRDPVALL
jgi:primosomal protein N' (replication factor Y)